MDFILFTGRYNSLTAQEVSARLPQAKLLYPHIYTFSAPSQKKAISLIDYLGTSFKLAVKLEQTDLSPAKLAPLVGHKNFSFTSLKGNLSREFNSQVKDHISTPSRFIKSHHYSGLTPVILQKKSVDEFFIDQDKKTLYQTVWTHDYRQWIDKDRRLPFADARSGILPPKIARSLINLTPYSGQPQDLTLLDPFCGSGRLLVEACQLGFHTLGSDIVQKKVDQTQANLKALNLQAEVFLADAVHVSKKVSQSVDLIVTEPYLGKPNIRPDRVKYVVPGLKKLYLGALKDWHKLLSPHGLVTIILPVFAQGERQISTSQVIDDPHLSGYNIKTRGLIYSRPQAKIKREIITLEKK